MAQCFYFVKNYFVEKTNYKETLKSAKKRYFCLNLTLNPLVHEIEKTDLIWFFHYCLEICESITRFNIIGWFLQGNRPNLDVFSFNCQQVFALIDVQHDMIARLKKVI